MSTTTHAQNAKICLQEVEMKSSCTSAAVDTSSSDDEEEVLMDLYAVNHNYYAVWSSRVVRQVEDSTQRLQFRQLFLWCLNFDIVAVQMCAAIFLFLNVNLTVSDKQRCRRSQIFEGAKDFCLNFP